MIEDLVVPGMMDSGGPPVSVVLSRLGAASGQSAGELFDDGSKSALTPVKRPDPFPPPDAFFRANKLAQENPSSDASPSARLAKSEEGRRALDARDVRDNDHQEPLSFSTPQFSADSFNAVAASVVDVGAGEAQQTPVVPQTDFENPQFSVGSAQVSAAHQAYITVQSLVGAMPDVSGVSLHA